MGVRMAREALVLQEGAAVHGAQPGAVGCWLLEGRPGEGRLHGCGCGCWFWQAYRRAQGGSHNTSS